MYDISQLNDMLVPELQDIAIEQNIPNSQKLEKQEIFVVKYLALLKFRGSARHPDLVKP
jgi:hypothetical protein